MVISSPAVSVVIIITRLAKTPSIIISPTRSAIYGWETSTITQLWTEIIGRGTRSRERSSEAVNTLIANYSPVSTCINRHPVAREKVSAELGKTNHQIPANSNIYIDKDQKLNEKFICFWSRQLEGTVEIKEKELFLWGRWYLQHAITGKIPHRGWMNPTTEPHSNFYSCKLVN